MKRVINDSPHLEQKLIPFIFLSTSGQPIAIEEAYDLMAIGYFTKQNSFKALNDTSASIIDYWKRSRQPYNERGDHFSKY